MLKYSPLPKREANTDNSIISQLDIIYKAQKKHGRLAEENENLINKYYSAITDYQNATGYYIPVCFVKQNIFYHFFVYNEQLFFHNKAVTNARQFFVENNWPTTHDLKAEQQLLTSLKRCLEKISSSLDEVIYFYNHTYGNTDLFSNFRIYFKLFDNNLFFLYSDKCSENFIIFFFSASNWEKFFKDIVHQPAPPSKFTKRLFKLVHHSLLKEQDGNFRLNFFKPDTPYYITVTYTPDNSATNERINVQNKNTFINITYDTSTCAFQRSFPILPSLDEKLLYQHTYPCSSWLPLSKDLAQALYHLTGGDLRLLNNLAILCANIAAPEVLDKKLFVIYGSDKIEDFFKYILIDQLQKIPAVSYTTNELLNPKKYVELSSLYLYGCKSIVLSDCQVPVDDEKIKCFRKIIKGSTIKSTDTMFGKISFTNTFPLLCFPKSHKEFVALTNSFPSIVLNFSNFSNYGYLAKFIKQNWMKLNFVMYGLKLTADAKNGKPLPKIKRAPLKVKHDHIINQFINCCCDTTQGSFIYAEELYEAYQLFFRTLFGSIPLKRSQFINQLKLCGDYEYKRPHTSRNEPNKWAFTNLKLKTDYKNRISAHAKPELFLEEQAFYDVLSEIDSLLPEDFLVTSD